jgi:hypothetical protein
VQKEAWIIYSAWNKIFSSSYFVFPCITDQVCISNFNVNFFISSKNP